LPVLAGVLAACVLVAGAGAVTKPSVSPRVQINTAAGLAKYLGSLKGVDLKRLVVQIGARNYAGPSCPGVGWTCTTAKHVLQYGTKNSFQCTPSSGGSATSPDSCTIVQMSTAANPNNSATCVETDTSATASQSCVIFQDSSSTSGSNTATVTQTINVAGTGTQGTSQYAGIAQTSDTGANTATVTQTINESTSSPGSNSGGTEQQDGHQGSSVSQNAFSTGSNTANVTQSLALSAMTSGVKTISQLQNTDQSQGPNSNSDIEQQSGSGDNTATLNQSNNLSAVAAGATSGTQTQGSPVGGQNGMFNQFSNGGTDKITGSQVEHQSQTANPVPGSSVAQTQYDPQSYDPNQFNSAANTYNLSQSSFQNQNKPGGFQDGQEFARCITSGECTVNEGITQNGQSSSNSCGPLSSCDINVTQTTTSEGTSSSTCSSSVDSEGGCALGTPQPPPSPCQVDPNGPTCDDVAGPRLG
jgi:hypothetical protein